MSSPWLPFAKWCTIIAAVATAALGHAAGLPDLTIPNGLGVNIHFTAGHEKDLEMIQAAGFKWVRQDFFWHQTERQKGVYDWSEFDAFTTSLTNHALRAYYILDYSNPLYEQTVASTNPITGKRQEDLASPHHPESVAAFAQWAGAAAAHFKGRGVVWEIWNEPNIFFWKPAPDANQYATLALAAAKAIRAADPDATIVAPASSGFPWEFIEAVFKAGLLSEINAVSVHPYRGGPPETVAGDYARLRQLMAKYGGTNVPIVSGEWGYATPDGGMSQEKQAAYAVRQQLANLSHGIPISIWYDWKNDGGNRHDPENNFGTVTESLNPKPAYTAIQEMVRQLAGYCFASRLAVTNQDDFILTFTNSSGAAKWAAWTIGQPHTVVSPTNLTLDALPIYVQASR